MTASTFEKKKIPPKPQPAQAQKKKKTKSAPDAPQPKWLFPPDEENPVLNPKAKTPEEVQQEKDEREKSISYMKRRVHAAPDRPAPPSELLTLVGIFLTEFGFNSTSRLFTNEREARKELDGWEDSIGTKIEKGTPTLEQIYREWYREWKIKRLASDETSSSDSGSTSSDSDDGNADVTTQANGVKNTDDDSEASSDGLGGSDVAMRDAPKTKSKKGKAIKKPSGSSSSSSTSDSDADDEGEKERPKLKTSAITKTKTKKPSTETNATLTKSTVTAIANKLKRKAPESDDDSSSYGSESSEDEKPAKRTKTTAISKIAAASLPDGASESPSDDSEEEEPAPATVKAEADSESSSSESSESESSEEEEVKPKNTINIVPAMPKASSDSSGTVNGDVKKVPALVHSETSSSATSASDSDDSDEKPAIKTPLREKKKHTGAKLTPLAELSAKGVEGAVSNQYQSYEYADKAYQDLSVTRGKGFTKEKNKKKRGSYRGGAIDTSGGKGFKFED